MSLCQAGGDRAAMRACLVEKRAALSAGCREQLAQRRAARRADRAAAPAPTTPATEISYGADPLQRIDFYKAKSATPTPLIVYLHGGGWQRGDKRAAAGAKPDHFSANGYAFASVNYRLVPQVSVDEQARDIARAIAALRTRAAALGVDPDAIVVMGHSAGAHLAALVAADPAWLGAAGVPFAALRGAVLIDGAGYDIVRQMGDAGPRLAQTYRAAFGTDLAAQRRLSPLSHAAAPNAPRWMIIYDAGRAAAASQGQALGTALRGAGAAVTMAPFEDTSHMKLNRELGIAANAETVAVDSFLRTAVR